MKYTGPTGEYFEISHLGETPAGFYKKEGMLSLIWFDDDNEITVDGKQYAVTKDTIICSTWLHNVDFMVKANARCLHFNSPFYCILDHDSEVGCKGILFFGSKHLPKIKPGIKDLEVLESAWKMVIIEVQSVDNLQLEMLQMMLKRILIICTRIYKAQTYDQQIESKQVNIVREFNFLVEKHFREKHTVADYAELLNRSPKTLSNLFGKMYHKTPLQLIQERKMLESRRLLKYTDRAVSDIAYHIGFNDIQSFSRFFKKHETMSPTDYRAV